MRDVTLTQLVRRLRHTVEACRIDELTDAELLEHFCSSTDPDAFEAIVRRHGERVLAACCKVLGDSAELEDVFQATFVVLLRQARTIRNRQSLGGYLYGVAHRIALQARTRSARRRRVEARPTPLLAEPPDLARHEARAILHEELDLLPDKYRLPLMLCYLDGMSRDEAARQLGVKTDVLRGRLERGRDRLRDRLTRRGVTLSVGLLAGIGNSVTAEGLPVHLVRSTMTAATGGPIPPAVAALLHGVAPSMTFKSKLLACVVLTVGLITGGIALRMSGAPPDGKPEEPGRKRPEPVASAAVKDEATETIECRGQVLDPDGKPVAGAKVTFHQKVPYLELPDFFPEPALGTADAEGRFRFPATIHREAPNRGQAPMLVLTAHVPGFGPAGIAVASADKLKEHTLRLVKDDVPIQGRILDLEGKPIPGVTVRPVAIVSNTANDLGPWEKVWHSGPWSSLAAEYRTDLAFPTAVAGVTGKAVTDADGKFTLSGFGRERIAVLRLEGPTIETALVNARTRPGPTIGGAKGVHGASFVAIAAPGLVVTGTVRDQDTGRPIAGVRIRRRIDYDYGWAEGELKTTTAADGRYRLEGLRRPQNRSRWALSFAPPAGQPYFSAQPEPVAAEPGKPARLDVELKRGVEVKGRVTDRATGKPVQAIVEYFAFNDNPHLKQVKDFQGSQAVSSPKDGSFVLTALPGRGIVAGKTDAMRRTRYLVGQGADRIAGLDKEDHFPTSPYLCWRPGFESLVGIEPDARAESVTCDLQFDPGKTVKGTLLDPDGKPLTGVSIRGPFGTLVNLRDLPTAQFTLTAVNPARTEAYFFEHREKKLAAAVLVKGDEPEGFAVKLQPGATVTGRLVTEDGEPIRNAQINGEIEGGQLNLVRGWGIFFWARTDAQGEFKIAGLLAGVRLRADVRTKERALAKLFQNLTFKPGEVRALGDVKVKVVRE